METEGLSLSLQGPATGPCPESDQCSARRHTRFLDIHFTVIFLSTAGSQLSHPFIIYA